MAKVGINEASRCLGVSSDTIRRRIKKGELPAYKENGVWYVDIPQTENASQDSSSGEVQALKQLVEVLKDELEARRREIQELHVLLRDTRALPPGREIKPFWKRLLPWLKS